MCTSDERRDQTTADKLFTATFVPFDLESAFCSGIIVLMASFIESQLVDNRADQLERTYQILDDLTSKGNMIARLRKTELKQLEKMLADLQVRENVMSSTTTNPGTTKHANSDIPDHAQLQLVPPLVGDGFQATGAPFDDWSWEAALDSAQLMYVAGLLDNNQIDSFDPPFDFDD